MTNITRALEGVLTWTDVVAGISATRTEFSRGSAYHATYTATETAIQGGTLTLATSSANTGTQNTVSMYLSAGVFPALNLVAVVNNTATIIAHT